MIQKNMKTYIVLFAIFATQCVFMSALFPVEDVLVLPKTGHTKPHIVFSHKLHSEDYGARCIDCHHTGKNIKCHSCHLRRDQGPIINLKGAFHQQCQECHRKTSGPKGCSRCHKSTAKDR